MTDIEDIVRRIAREELDKALEANTPRVIHEQVIVDERRLYSVASAAKLLEVSTSYIYDQINARDVAVVELGSERSKQRISAPELQRFIDARTFGR